MARGRGGIARWMEQRLGTDPPRSKSLIMTVFGDSIAPYAAGVWLSDLIALMEPFGVNERLVRTSGFRLAEEGWLLPERHGRRSRYTLTDSGWERVEHASERIYAPPPERWKGRWTLLMLRRAGNGAAERLQLKRELQWEGFGVLAPGMFVHPCANATSLREVLGRLGMLESVVLLEAAELGDVVKGSNAMLVSDCWQLEQVRAHYDVFLARFRPAVKLVENALDPKAAFVVQTLMIHAFRRVVLHDPRLPRPLLQEEWPGHAAYELCRELYSATHAKAREFLLEHVEGIRPTTRSTLRFMSRFGGLRQ